MFCNTIDSDGMHGVIGNICFSYQNQDIIIILYTLKIKHRSRDWFKLVDKSMKLPII